jgi:phospholipid transport system substrate-binding protein
VPLACARQKTHKQTEFGMRIAQACATLSLIVVASSAGADIATLEAPARQIQSFSETLTDSMRQAQQLGVVGRYNKLKPAVEQTFDIATMTQLAVGPSWSSTPASDQKALIQAFERLTIANYARNFDGYNGERFVVDPKVVERGADRLVQSRLEQPRDAAVPFVYRMRQSGNSWKVIDVYLNGTVSELATRRSDFSTTISSSGSTGLIRQINALSDKLMAGS